MVFRVLLGAALVASCSKSPESKSTPEAKAPPPVVASSANDPDASVFQDVAPTQVTPGKTLTLECATPKEGVKDKCVDLLVDSPTELAVGAQAKITVDMKAIQPYHLNVLPDKELGIDPPDWFVQVLPTAGIELPLHMTDLGHATKKALEETAFELAYTAKSPGTKQLHAAVQYAACAKSACVPGVVHLTWNVAVK